VSNTARDTGAINAFGDLSRRARRELEESGVNPDDARDQLLATGSIQLPTGSVLTSDGVSSNTGGLSRRELRAMQERTEQVASPSTGSPLFDAASAPLVERLGGPRFSLPTAPGAPGSRGQQAAQPSYSSSPQTADLGFSLSPALSDNATPVEQVIRHTTTPLEQMMSQQAMQPATNTSGEPFGLSTQSTGVISTTSHALIIPSPPDPLSGPIMSLDQTGEVMLTGQIVLPASLGATGADSGRLDRSEVDVIDYGSEITPSQDLAPVRATAAVSATVTRGGAVTSPIKSRDRVPLALTVTATFLAVAVVGLFVTGYLLGVF
jgi:hypothetical protein